MKNLKKVLSVVLAVAMMLSIVATAGAVSIGSETYGDYDAIVNKDAVDVLTELEILDGYDDGNYHPEANLTRAQMAKIITYIVAQPELTTNTTIDKYIALYKSAVTFEDVAKDVWYAGPVGYAQETGIVNGDNGVSFRPEDNVKLVEAAKMLLVALGYDAEASGLVGSNWVGNVIALALSKGLLDGIDTTDVHAYITRDEMAQMTYNMLLANMVGYIEVDGALIAVDQINGLAEKYGNNFNWWMNTDLIVGKQAMAYYFGKDSTVITGIVVANAYTNLGIVEQDLDAVTFAGITVEEYDADEETVIYVAGGECIETGYCSGDHNIYNANCPANTDPAALWVIPIATCFEEIGREVKVTAVGNVNQGITYKDLIVTANNAAEKVVANGAIEDTIALAKDTVITGIFNCEECDAEFTDADVVGEDGKLPADWTKKGMVHYNIDNDADDVADFSITVEELLFDDTVDADAKFVNHDDALAAVSLAHESIAGHIFADNIDKNTGVITGFTGNALGCTDYNTIWVDGVAYAISELCTTDIEDKHLKNIGDTCEFWLDHAGNIVKFNLTPAPAGFTALIYGIERNVSTEFGAAEEITYTLKTVTKDGVEKDVILEDGVELAPGVAAVIFDNTKAMYGTISYNRAGEVNKIEYATNVNGTTYTKAQLVLGSASGVTKVANAVNVLYTALDNVKGYVNDATIFFNFQPGFGGYVQPDGGVIDFTDITSESLNEIIATSGLSSIGNVTITAGPATVADTMEGSTFLGVDALVGEDEIADIVVLTIGGAYKALAPVANKAIDKTEIGYNQEYIYITAENLANATYVANGIYDANGTEKVLWTIPVSGARTSITVDAPEQYEIAAWIALAGEGEGAIFSVSNKAGINVDFVDVLWYGLYEDTVVKTASDVMDRIALANVSDDDRASLEGDFWGNLKTGYDAWTVGYTAESVIYEIANGTMTAISGADIVAGDTVLYVPVAMASEANASAFAETIMVAFVFPAPVAAN